MANMLLEPAPQPVDVDPVPGDPWHPEPLEWSADQRLARLVPDVGPWRTAWGWLMGRPVGAALRDRLSRICAQPYRGVARHPISGRRLFYGAATSSDASEAAIAWRQHGRTVSHLQAITVPVTDQVDAIMMAMPHAWLARGVGMHRWLGMPGWEAVA